jgi:hypothetical protein
VRRSGRFKISVGLDVEALDLFPSGQTGLAPGSALAQLRKAFDAASNALLLLERWRHDDTVKPPTISGCGAEPGAT